VCDFDKRGASHTSWNRDEWRTELAEGERLVLTAIVKTPARSLVDACELTFLDRVPIDFERALAQHAEYCKTLARADAQVITLAASSDFADSVFVEDTAVILDELAIITRPGALSRRAEPAYVEPALARYRRVERLHAPGTLEGGDVLRVGRTLFVGTSTRTNGEGIRQLELIARPLGYTVIPVVVLGSLHLKTACTALDAATILLNPDWIDIAPFTALRCIPVAADEPFGANVLPMGSRLIANAAFPRTLERIATHCEASGVQLIPVDISEFGKAEAGLTCLSLLLGE
jgi:dimethylargininase